MPPTVSQPVSPTVSPDDTFQQSPPRVVPTEVELAEAAALPMSTRFSLGEHITGLQQAFLELHGFLVFDQVARPEEVERILAEVDAVQEAWLAEGRESINGIPLVVGEDEAGAPFIQRFAFTSVYSEYIRDFVRDPRFLPVRGLVGERTRVGDTERDGVVFNRNMTVEGSAYTRLGWHTDGLRDLFILHPTWPWLRPPGPMLNVGMHFDRVRAKDGGLRLDDVPQALLPLPSPRRRRDRHRDRAGRSDRARRSDVASGGALAVDRHPIASAHDVRPLPGGGLQAEVRGLKHPVLPPALLSAGPVHPGRLRRQR
jgi:hypothetical protein